MTTISGHERSEWIRLRANNLQQHGPDEFPRGYYEAVAADEWDDDLERDES